MLSKASALLPLLCEAASVMKVFLLSNYCAAHSIANCGLFGPSGGAGG